MRPEKQGSDRARLAVGVLEEAIAEEAFVRVIDLFVDQLGDLSKLGFSLPPERPREKGGAPAYAHSTLLKCYLYGYYYSIRSSRRLARQCRINIEMMWLLEGLQPEYHTKGLMDALKSWKLDLDWVEKAQFFLFSLLGALCRLTQPQPQCFRFSRPDFLPDFYAVSRSWG